MCVPRSPKKAIWTANHVVVFVGATAMADLLALVVAAQAQPLLAIKEPCVMSCVLLELPIRPDFFHLGPDDPAPRDFHPAGGQDVKAIHNLWKKRRASAKATLETRRGGQHCLQSVEAHTLSLVSATFRLSLKCMILRNHRGAKARLVRK